jgi:superfamily II DNA or RNA helicase
MDYPILVENYFTKVTKRYIDRGSSLDDIIKKMEPNEAEEFIIRRIYSKLTGNIPTPTNLNIVQPNTKTTLANIIPLRPYQVQTVSEAQQILKTGDRCYIKLPTGAGKTRIMYKLIDDDFKSVMKVNGGRLEPGGIVYICMSPRIDLANQHFRSDKAKDMDTPFRLIKFYSKVDNFTLDAQYCEWSRDKEALIISGLYQSLDRLKAWLETWQLTKYVRYVFSDEAHLIARWCQPKILERDSTVNWFITGIWSSYLKRVYLSATPTENQVIDFGGNWGPLIKPVTVGQLITEQILCPIETLIPNVRVTESLDSKGNLRTGLDSGSMCEILYKTLVHTNAQKAVVFCNTTAKCRELRDLFIRESARTDLKIKAYIYVSGLATVPGKKDSVGDSEEEESEDEEFEDIRSNKYKNLEEEKRGEIVLFENCPTPAVVFVCKRISMGYDYPPIDFIAFADPKCAKAELAQCIGRGLRSSTGKTVCRVFIPITPADYTGDTKLKRRHLTLFEYLNYLKDEVGYDYQIKDRKDIKRTTELNGGGVDGVSSARYPMMESSVTLNIFGDIPGYDFLDENKICLVLAKESILNNHKSDFSWDNYNRVQHEYYKSRNREYGFKTVKEYFNCDTVKFTDWLDPNVEDLTTMFGKYWKGWYDFLGIDTARYPPSMDAWIAKCRELGIGSHSKYYDSLVDNPDLPDEPGYLYQNFTNINACLGMASYRRR